MKKLIYTLSCVLFLFACEENIEIDIIREDPKIVLHSYFENEKIMTVDLVRSIPIPNPVDYDRTPYHINDAKVNVFENEVLLGAMAYEGEGRYVLNQYPQNDKSYRIEVNAPGLNKVTTGPEMLPSRPVIRDYQFRKQFSESQSQNISVEHTLKIENNPGQIEYYRISLEIWAREFKNGELNKTQLINFYRLASNNPALKDYHCLSNCYGESGTMKSLYFSNESFGDSPEINLLLITDYFQDYVLNYPNETLHTEYVQSIKVSKISASMMDYARTIDENSNSNQIFQEPVTIISNVNDGLGVFGTMSSVELEYDFSE
jgi:hypothetical protein